MTMADSLTELLNDVSLVLSCRCGCDPEPEPEPDPGPGNGGPEYGVSCEEPQQGSRCVPPDILDARGFFEWAQDWWVIYVNQTDIADLALGRQTWDVVQASTLMAGILTKIAFPGSPLAKLYMVAMMRNQAVTSAFEAQPSLTKNVVLMVQAARPLLSVLWRNAYQATDTGKIESHVSDELRGYYTSFVTQLRASNQPALRTLGKRIERTFGLVAGLSIPEALAKLSTTPR